MTHVHKLRPFIYDPDRTSPMSVAEQNEQEFVVEITRLNYSIGGDSETRVNY